MNALLFIMALEMGWMPGMIVNYDPLRATSFANLGYVKFDAEASWGGFYVGGTSRIIMQKSIDPWYAFWPTGLWSTIDTGWRNGWFNLGWRHECDHPVVVSYQKYPGIIKWEAGWDELFMRATLRLEP